jgi:AP-1 complex subunit sigma 1/2
VDHKIKKKTQREVTQLVLSRPSKMCNFIEWKDQKIIFKRWANFTIFACIRNSLTTFSYASLYFVCGVDKSDNELITLEASCFLVE